MATLKVSKSPAPVGGPNRRARRHPVEQAYIGLPEAATYLGVAEKTIRRLIRDSKLPAYRLGNRVIKIKIEDLETVLRPMGGGAA
jgi:excisionase family DNA binding protein